MIKNNVSLKPFNTFGIDVNAKHFAKFNSTEDLIKILRFESVNALPKLILGGGSNILLTNDFDGIVLKIEIKGIQITKDTNDYVLVKAGAGEVWHDLVMYAVENGYSGIENLALIPGSVGAAPMQNIGAYGVEIKDVFFELHALNLETLEEVRFTKKRCQFGYRESVFKRHFKGQFIITSVTLKLLKKPKLNTSYGAIKTQLEQNGVVKPNIQNISQAIIQIRKSKLPDPKQIGNSGSFFKNPVISTEKFKTLQAKFPEIAHYIISETEVKLAAGWLIDQAGWKGKTIESEFGQYGVHKNQALVLVNYDGVPGELIYKLSEDIISDIKAKYDVELEREVNVIS
ncbi:MAG: UDP-N-acetylmuramate dehydrogenase [Putridiphycobacter sp.]